MNHWFISDFCIMMQVRYPEPRLTESTCPGIDGDDLSPGNDFYDFKIVMKNNTNHAQNQ